MARRALAALLLAGFIASMPSSASRAQEMAALVADAVHVDPSGTLVATGGVEVFYQGRILRAKSISFDKKADRLAITGPIVLVDAAGDAVVVASQADLSADLTEGVLQSARLVLNRELQLAADQIQRIGGRYTTLDNAVASSCKVCAGSSTPLWEIRASRVVHDQSERQIYFDNAQFRVAGLPVLYVPRLRMPDPSLKRSTGVLMPQIRTTTGLGTGFKLPYFIALGPSRDLTITPYISTKSAQTVELRYRQAFRTGEIELTGALSKDRLVPGSTRHHLTATGTFDLPRDFKLAFSGEIVSDPAYLLDYGLPVKDRLDSRVEVTRTRRNEHISGRLIGFHSIRAGEANSTLPSIVSDFTFHRRFSGGPLGGEAGLRFQTQSRYRSSASSLDLNADGIGDGRDLGRASLRLDWRRNWVLPAGIVGTVLGEVTADAYSLRQDAVYGANGSSINGAAAMEFRWPWAKTQSNGVGHVIEPVVQFIFARSSTDTRPNEDSVLVEFDEGNLFTLSHYPGSDVYERGQRVNLGLSYSRIDPLGWTFSAALGRVFRKADLNQFTLASGLGGKQSDWLAALQLALPGGLGITHRMLVKDSGSLTKSETRLEMIRETYGISGSYVWVQADTTEGRADPISEMVLDGSYKITENWKALGSARYDFEANRANRAALGVQFRNECVSVDLSLSRRFTSSTNVTPTTDFGLSVDLVGFGSRTSAGPARMCRR